MQTTNCPYVKISQAEVVKTSVYLSAKDPNDSTQNNVESKNNFASSFSLVSTANAQAGTVQTPDVISNLSNELTIPFYLVILSFFAFVILMSAVYIYHWNKFSLNDPFIKNFTPVYFFGLVLLSIPLIFNLFF